MEEIRHQLFIYCTILYRVLYIPGGAGFLPSTVCVHLSDPFIHPIVRCFGPVGTHQEEQQLAWQFVYLVQLGLPKPTWGLRRERFGGLDP